jgi:iron(III) transport system substrate-binding protein
MMKISLLLWSAALVGMAACSERGTVLTVYSPHGREQLVLFEERFEAANPGVDVQWVDMGSQEILDRVRSERANPQGDVWYGGPAWFFSRAAGEGLLEAYRPSWAEAVLPEARGPDDLFFGVYLTPAVITFNSEVVSRDDAPRDWDDILDARWADEVLIRDPLASGTMRMIFGMIMYRSIKQTGGTEAGYDWLRRLDGQTKEYVLNPAILQQKLARQEGLVTLWNLPDVLRVQNQGFPVDYVLPESGTPVLVDGIAVIKGTKQRQLAQAFVEYIGSVEGQLVAARQAYRNLTRTDIPPDSLPQWLVQVSKRLQPMDLDWALMEEQGREWMRYWDSHIRGTGR